MFTLKIYIFQYIKFSIIERFINSIDIEMLRDGDPVWNAFTLDPRNTSFIALSKTSSLI